ncbi:MAG TPA: hypothetical protein VGK09_10685 [Rhodocyclaceae bacterium]|jgi:hypothetical protein
MNIDMTKNILELPEKPIREWFAIRGEFSALLKKQGHDEEVIEHVCERLREPCIFALNQNMTITPGSGDEAVQTVNVWFGDVMNALLLYLANLAIENYELRQMGKQK